MCNCNLCSRGQQFKKCLDKIPEQDQEFWKTLYELLNNVEEDRDYYKAIVNGTWPNADEIISYCRSKNSQKEIVEQAKIDCQAIIDSQIMEEWAEQRYNEALDAEGHEPEPPKKFTVMTREFGEITVDEDTYYKYYDKLTSL